MTEQPTNPDWNVPGTEVVLTEKLLKKFIQQIRSQHAVWAAQERVAKGRGEEDTWTSG
jgi:hypothetical protein